MIRTEYRAQSVCLPGYGLYNCPEAGSCMAENTDHTAVVNGCACTCSSKDIMASDLYNTVFAAFGFTSSFDDATLTTVLDYMCSNSIVVGDHGSSSSANDPSFWSVHSTVERYSQIIRLNKAFDDESWPDDDSCLFDTNIHPFTDTCTGHYATDVLSFGSVDGRTFTNEEYYAYLDPTTPSGTYVFDNFEFQHCADVGVTIDATMFAPSRRLKNKKQ